MNKTVYEILSLIENNGYICYIIGGYVRDYLLNIKSNDYDLCTNATMDTLKILLKDYEYKIYFDTMKLCIKDISIEITPFRVELEYKNRKPTIYYNVDTLKEDISRRDFTINTICMDLNNNIIDLLDGINEIKSRVIKCVGDCNIKLKEDPLRILRALRFSAYLDFKIDDKLKKAIIDNSHLLLSLSYEKKKEEIDKIININRLDILKLYNLDKYLDINLSNICYYKYNILTWYNIDYLNKYLISNNDKKIIYCLNNLYSKKFDNYYIYLYGYDIVCLASEFYNIDLISKYNSLTIKCRKDIDITSEELLNIINNKKELGNIYTLIEKKILNNELENKKYSIINYLKNIY